MAKNFTNQLASIIEGEMEGNVVMIVRCIGAGVCLVSTSNEQVLALPKSHLRLWKVVTEIDTRM
jgi:hypothetical protein